jgi:hypothetical protein
MHFISQSLQITGIIIIYLSGVIASLFLQLYLLVKFSWWETVEFYPELIVLLFLINIFWLITMPIILIGLGCIEIRKVLFKNNKEIKE